MNIFATSPYSIACAQALDDLRLRKMITETAQILSTVAIHHRPSFLPQNLNPDDFYKPTHQNHPCVRWAAAWSDNFVWLADHLDYLLQTYHDRTEHQRLDRFARAQAIFDKLVAEAGGLIGYADHSPFPNCTPHKGLPTHEAYRLTLNEKWAADKRPPTWTNATPPDWANFTREENHHEK